MSIYRELSYEHEIETIKGIRFSVLSPEEIFQNSVAEVYKTDTYVGTDPVINGLFDPRMGVLDHNKVCQTCEQKMVFCPGHFGHINLAKPVFYIQFFDYVKKILKCVCFRCSKLLINPDSPAVQACLNKKLSRQKRWELIYKLSSKVRRCGQETLDGCGAKQPEKITREPIVKIVMEWKDLAEDVKKQVFNAEEVLRILKRITDRDAEILGFCRKYNRPEWMIATRLSVPPPAVRPSVRTDTGQRSEDDLTHKLCDIVKSNNSLKSKIEKKASKEQIDIATQVLQYHVATFIDNNIPGINPAQQRTGRLLKSLTERLKSKDGRIRGNLMGKRVDFSARSVITPDPNISIDELGVPIKIAMNLTFPEIVNKHNKEKLIQFVKNGPDVYPGAKFIRKKDRTIGLKNMIDRDSLLLEEGDIVDRHMLDGDPVLFNRQPSLHKYSMMCHRAKIMQFNTFRLNVCACNSYNADFDGDEMNMHLPQSIVTASELQDLAAVANQIISVRECKPIISIVQDVALGVYRFTKSSVTLTEKQVMNLLASNPQGLGMVPEPSFVDNYVKKWNGRQVMSTIIPANTNLRAPNKLYDEDKPDDRENYVVIENGVHKQGILDKYIYQNRTKGLIHSIFNECSPDDTRRFLDNTQKIICDWLVQAGFSVGVSDIMIDAKTDAEIKKMVHEMKVHVYDIIRNIHLNNFENKSINDNNDYFEEEVNKILNNAQNKVGKEAKSKINDMQNRMINMVNAGSKGSIINVSQMIACLGQVNVDGKRIAYGFDDRTLPHYTKFDDGPESRGFVENSFIKGLTPQEFFFHAMGGREGLIDTAVKTSETGYLQRKLVKAMEDCKINHDFTVRNASGSIIQFLYGEDGMDASKIENQPLIYIDKNFEELKREYLLTAEDDLTHYLNATTLREFQSKTWEPDFRAHFDQVLADREYLIQKVFDNKKETSILYPISFMRLINNAKATFRDNGQSDLNPSFVLATINDLCEELYVSNNNRGNKLLQMLIRCYLSPKKIALDYKFNRATFEYMIQQIKLKFYDAIAHPSEMVGVIAAQSIGEPSTQMSMVRETRVKVLGSDGFAYNGTIGSFIDDLLERNAGDIVDLGDGSSVLNTPLSYKILGVSREGGSSWMSMSQVSRHPARGGLVKVTTLSGKTTTATLSHSFLKRTAEGIEPIKGADLRVGQTIPLAKRVPMIDAPLETIYMTGYGDVPLSEEFGRCCGIFLAKRRETTRDLNDFLSTNFGNKTIPGWVFAANADYIAGFIEGYMKNPCNTREITTDIIVLLSYLNIFACLGSNDNIQIPPESVPTFCARFPTVVFELSLWSSVGMDGGDVIWDKIVDLEYLEDPKDYVYDFTVPDNETFMADAGIYVHNTLNSVEWHTPMLFSVNNTLKKVKIGEFIDDYLLRADKIEDHPNDTKYASIENIRVLSCDEQGRVDWQKVEAVTRHPPINKDGSKTLLKVTTDSGRMVIATKAKSFLKRVNNKIIQVDGEDIRVGDHLPISKHLPISREMILKSIDGYVLDPDFGCVFGGYLARGSHDKTTVSIPGGNQKEILNFCEFYKYDYYVDSSDTIHIYSETLSNFMFLRQQAPFEWIIQTNLDFIGSFLTAIFEDDIKISGVPEFLELVQQLLARIDIPCEIHEKTLSLCGDSIIPDIMTREYGILKLRSDEIYEYIQKAKYAEDKDVFIDVLNEEIFYDKVISIEEIQSEYPYVYDLTVEKTRNFNIYNGLAMADTFHLSGVSSASKAVRGVPRIKELLSVTKNIKTPALTIYLKEEFRKEKKLALDVLNTIQTTYFSDIIQTTQIYYEPDNINSTIADDELFLRTYKEFIDQSMLSVQNLSPWLLRMEFDRDKMHAHNITMIDIYNALEDFYEDQISAMFSDDNANKLVFRIKLYEPEDKHDDIITDLKALEKNILENLIVKGVRKISKVIMDKKEYFAYNEDELVFEKMHEWVLETSGTNLLDIFGHKSVEASRTISNDINEIYEVLGIEAARQALYNEISDVIKFADLYVNYRHLALLVDTMTNKGYLLSIDRHGINRVDIGPLAKSSFEETNDMIVKAGIFAELDKINGVSACVMLGQTASAGTGDTDILIDEDKLPRRTDLAIAPEESSLMPEEMCELMVIEYTLPPMVGKKMKKQTLKFV